MSPTGVLLGAALALLVLILVATCLLRANRLDRLHVRTDAARAALLGSLERRAVVARSVAVRLGEERLRMLASRAEAAPPAEREAVENDLSRLLATVPLAGLPGWLAAELEDAQLRVMLARRVHNDAVRDTRALRSGRLVRWLRLAGGAPDPGYFEIVDAEPAGQDTDVIPPKRRRAGRVVLVDPVGRVLLFEGFDPARPRDPYWFTPGGGVEPGEDGRAAALRELAEETGVRLAAESLVGPVWRRYSVFSYAGENLAAEEEFFLGWADVTWIDTSGFSELERDTVLRYRWWTGEELCGTAEVVYPRQLGDLLTRLHGRGWDGVTRVVS